MRGLPRGTVTFLFTDVEGSTRLLHDLGAEGYAAALAEHRRVLREAFGRHGGVEVDTQGDAFFVAFERAGDAVACAADAQASLAEGPVRVRMGIHTGEPVVTDEGYVGVDVHRAARIASAGHGGQVLLSQTTRDLVEADVRDLGKRRLKDLTAPVHVYQLGFGDFPSLATLDASNLPVAATPLVGREREVAELSDLLDGDLRLVTITGPGGIGKTRVALQIAAELVGSFRDGVFWVPLAGVGRAEFVLPAIAQALETRDDVLAHIRGRELLLLLDSVEHLLDAAPALGELLAAAPDLKLLATSRSPLHLSGEKGYPLEPLSTADASALFVERASAIGAREVNIDATVREICGRVDNLPLAVELAAARMKLFDPESLLARLDQRLPMLTGGSRDAPERQRTLRATIAWSYELLDSAGKQLLPRLGVFVGPFAVDAAEEVCTADLDTLAALADASLLKPLADGRLLMLDTIREFAHSQLEPEALEELRGRHSAYYAGMADGRWAGLVRGDDADWLECVKAESRDLQAALDWALAQRDGERALAVLSGIWPAISDQRLLRGWLESALAATAATATLRRAFAWAALANTASFQGDLEVAEDAAAQAVRLLRELEQPQWLAAALSTLADIARDRGELEIARRHAEESVEIRRQDPVAFNLGRGLITLAVQNMTEGDFARARDVAEEAVAWQRKFLPAGHHLPEFLCVLGEIRRRCDDADGAVQAFVEALHLGAIVDEASALMDALDGLALLLWQRGSRDDSVRLAGAAQRARDDLGFRRFYPDRPTPARVEPVWSEGYELALDDAVRFALSSID